MELTFFKFFPRLNGLKVQSLVNDGYVWSQFHSSMNFHRILMAVNANENSIRIENVLIQDKSVFLCGNQYSMNAIRFKNKQFIAQTRIAIQKKRNNRQFFDLNK